MGSLIPPLPGEEHVCPACGTQYGALPVNGALEGIGCLPKEIRAATHSVRPASVGQRPDLATWSVLEYVCHLRDVYATSTIRLYRTRVERSPTLEPMLNDLRAARFRYYRRDIGAVLDELTDNVEGLLDEATRFSGAQWDRVAPRLPGEERSARWIVRHALHEGRHHLGDISAVRARL